MAERFFVIAAKEVALAQGATPNNKFIAASGADPATAARFTRIAFVGGEPTMVTVQWYIQTFVAKADGTLVADEEYRARDATLGVLLKIGLTDSLVLIEEWLYAAFERYCKAAGIEVTKHYFDGTLSQATS